MTHIGKATLAALALSVTFGVTALEACAGHHRAGKKHDSVHAHRVHRVHGVDGSNGSHAAQTAYRKRHLFRNWLP